MGGHTHADHRPGGDPADAALSRAVSGRELVNDTAWRSVMTMGSRHARGHVWRRMPPGQGVGQARIGVQHLIRAGQLEYPPHGRAGHHPQLRPGGLGLVVSTYQRAHPR